ncbi:MAG: SRPBCC family protein [Candidatus Acidiferrales bacterium]
MSVKKEPNGRRSVQVEVEVPGTPEEVWQAIATGPGVSSWFVPTEVDEREGTVTMDFGPGMRSVAKVTAWDPPRRFVVESHDWGPNSPLVATEWTVEARAGGTCVVRVVHSLFAETDDWDGQLEGTESGWPGFFRILRLYLTHFRGLPCSTIRLMAMTPETEAKAWETLVGSLGLAGAAAGQRRNSLAGVPPFAGVVEAVRLQATTPMIIRLEQPAPGIASFGAYACGGPVMVAMTFYLYGDRAAAAAAQHDPAWQKWMSEKFPSVGQPTA